MVVQMHSIFHFWRDVFQKTSHFLVFKVLIYAVWINIYVRDFSSKLKQTSRNFWKENMLNKDDCHLLFKLRSMTLDVKSNFSNLYQDDLICRTCDEEGVVENNQHPLQYKCWMMRLNVCFSRSQETKSCSKCIQICVKKERSPS